LIGALDELTELLFDVVQSPKLLFNALRAFASLLDNRRQGRFAGRPLAEARSSPENPSIDNIKARDEADDKPERLAWGWRVFPREIVLAIRATLGFFQNLAFAIRARNTKIVVFVWIGGHIELARSGIRVRSTVPFVVVGPTGHREDPAPALVCHSQG
jgi:hypothetical protein